MASLTQTNTGTREFRVPFDGPMPGALFRCGGDLSVAPGGDAPPSVPLAFYPTAFEFQARAPKLLDENDLGISIFDLLEALTKGGVPVVTYAGGPGVLARIPAGLADLDALEAYLARGPALFDTAEYALSSVSIESA